MKIVLVTLVCVGGFMLYFSLWNQVICEHMQDKMVCKIISYL